ncbi:hypothetical protein [Candidatus Chloroploca sp. Khr17]|uniref:hypothetical protein n=1 Tax=Candidatus Chloroploca sp. Khr17 TaxID=2496869 RepID=UPI00101C795F|nr:hypothetical protein [Candidatus Chloroploca sp. Khr17]
MVRWLTALLLYAGLAVVMTWPLAREFQTALIGAAAPGEVYDSWQHLWNLWWLKTALLTRQVPWYTAMLFHPDGASLWLHTLTPINFLLTLPLQAVFGLVVAFNSAVLINLTLSGLCTYALARYVLAHQPDTSASSQMQHGAALISGVIFASSGYLVSQAMGAHTNLLAAWTLPLAILMFYRVVDQLGRATIIFASLGLLITALADWHYTLFALLWAGWQSLVMLWQRRQLRVVMPLVISISLALILLAPAISLTAREIAATPAVVSEGGVNFRRDHALDLVDLVIPSPLHPLWGQAAAQLQSYKAAIHTQSKVAYLGFVTLVLAGLGLWRGRNGFWIVSAAFFIMLALGPVLQIAGWSSGLVMPGALLAELPLLNIVRYPIRFISVTMLALSIAAAFGVCVLLRQTRANWGRGLITTSLIALIVFENLSAPFPLTGVYIPAQIAAMGEDTETYAVMHVPVYWRTRSLYMLYQTVHQKPLMGGYLSREPAYPTIEQIPLLRMFAYARSEPDIIVADPTAIAPSVFGYFDVRYLMLHGEGGALRYNTLVRVAQAASDGPPEQIEIPGSSFLRYHLAEPANPVPFLGLGEGWSDLVGTTSVERQFHEQASLIVYSSAPHEVVLEMDVISPVAGTLRLTLGGDSMQQISLKPGVQLLRIPLRIVPGETHLLLESEQSLTVRRIELF